MTAIGTTLFKTPDWMEIGGSAAHIERRKEAEQRALQAGLPSFEEELWRYTPIDELDLSKYKLELPGGSVIDAGLTNGLESDAAAVIDVVNGKISSISTFDDSISVHSEGGDLENAIGSVVSPGFDFFADCNLAYSSAPIFVEIERNSVVASPILIRHHTTANNLAWFPRVIIHAGENSQATVVEHQSSSAVDALVCPVIEINVAQAARLKYLTVQEHEASIWQIATQVAQVERDAHVSLSQVALGGFYARARIDTKMVGQGSSSDTTAVYFGKQKAKHDFRTFQKHEAPHSNSNLLFKGVVDDESRAIYTGLIRIEPAAGDVNAYQTNRTLKLSDEAWAESVPNLEIENNDVKCSHASAVGPINEEQKFYLESRGVPADIAEALVVKGFFGDVLEGLPSQIVSEAVNRRIEEFLALDLERPAT
ncbi:MAG TPA: Fe-S cluster assembly protein SufD [Acidimicrobiaceae bacterium]|nr:Fe-S cluster assembly protein SufD [Acidimicrobiaceae bacterium]